MITDNSFDVFWLKPGLKQMIILVFMNLLHQATVIKHEPRQTGRGGGVATIYSDMLNVTQKTGYRFDSFEILA